MKTVSFRKAERAKAKLRLGIGGPSGAGKTYSALLIASGLVSPNGRIAVIDTEHGSAELYADLFDYDVATLVPPFTPQKYISTVKEAESLGYEVIIVDSLSHAWRGEGGMMDMHDAITQATKNSYTAWREVSPLHNKLVEALLQSSAHVITTLRAKQEYVVADEDGKKSVRKVGLAPIFRDGIEYEFTMYFEMTPEHLAVVSKDRTGLFGNNPPFVPTKQTGETIRQWLESGVDRPQQADQYEIACMALVAELEGVIEKMRNSSEAFKWYNERKQEVLDLPPNHREKIYKILRGLKNPQNLQQSKNHKEPVRTN